MNEKYIIVEVPTKQIICTSSTRPKLDPAEVAKALGAKPTPAGVGADKSVCRATGVVPSTPVEWRTAGLPDADKVAKVPVSETQWKRLEELAVAIAAPGFSPSAGQVANVLLTWALDNLGPDAIKELTSKPSEPST